MSGKRWEKWEDKLVIDRYADRNLMDLLGRSWDAIRTRAGELGVTREFRPWKAREEREFLSLFPTTPIGQLAKRFPHRSVSALKRKAYDFGLRGPRRGRRHERPKVVSEIRAECARRGIMVATFVRDLGGNPQYLSPGPIFLRGLPLALLESCAEKLGGEIYVEWED